MLILGIAGASYIPTVQAALPRLLGAAAPPGAGARENRRQCHKVLIFTCLYRCMGHAEIILNIFPEEFSPGSSSLAGEENLTRICSSTLHG